VDLVLLYPAVSSVFHLNTVSCVSIPLEGASAVIQHLVKMRWSFHPVLGSVVLHVQGLTNAIASVGRLGCWG
jgi:hypothetical protein